MSNGRPGAPPTWTDEQVAALQAAVDRSLTSGQIAMRLGFTRNAIISKVMRLGLHLHGKPHGRNTTQRQATPRAKKIVETAMPAASIEAAAYEPKPCTLLELDHSRQCHWPLDEWRDGWRLFCGGPREYPGDDGHHVYCAYHASIAYPTGDRRRANGSVTVSNLVRNAQKWRPGIEQASGAPFHFAGVPP